MKITTIVGVRPQFVKAAVLSPVIRKENTEILIHTGQHYDENMSAVYFKHLGIPEPDYLLDAKSAKGDIVLWMETQLEAVLQKERPDAILIYGDTNTTLAGALAADNLKIPAIHVEAGERNGLTDNPEEQIRKTVDRLSSLLLCCSEQAADNLYKEGLGEKSYYIGNLMELSFLKNVTKPWHPKLISLICPNKQVIDIPQKFYLLTCHRQENANDKNITEILLALEQAKYAVIFPVHPRNKERILNIYDEYKLHNIILTEPVNYFDSIHLIKNAVAVVTDSGGVLQEAHFAQTPYVFVLDIPQAPKNTRFDVTRLAKPKRYDILRVLNQEQKFNFKKGLLNDAEKCKILETFACNILEILRDFEQRIVKGWQ